MKQNNFQNQSYFKEITYLGFALTDKLQEELIKLDSAPHFATFNFSWSLIRSLQKISDKVSIISSHEVRNYPGVKKIVFFSDKFYWNGFEIIILGFINIIVLKHLTKLFQLFRSRLIYRFVCRSDLLVVHGSHTPYLIYANIMKIFGKRILLVLTDEHGFVVSSDGFLGVIFRKIDYFIMRCLVGRFDAYVCLSSRFVKTFKLRNVLLVPGIVPIDTLKMPHCDLPKIFNSSFHIVYAGNINNINGIDLLLSAIKEIKNTSLTLSIFGKGEMVDRVLDYQKLDPRVSYKGVVDRNLLLVEFSKANLLVNPRPGKSIINEYSFPSKLIEFLSTGTPVLTAKAVNIPFEIESCFLYFEEDSYTSLASAIEYAISMHGNELENFGTRAAVKVAELYSEKSLGENIRALF
jgi:glycosyltransferase involved in cell wall biosynthesis